MNNLDRISQENEINQKLQVIKFLDNMFTRVAPSEATLVSNAISKTLRCENTNKDKIFLLIRFKEGIDINTEILRKHGIIKWSMPFIPVIGIEIDKSNECFIEEVQKINGFKKMKEVQKFHEHSYVEI